MKQFTMVSGTAIPMAEDNIDTDQLCPKQHLLRLEKTGFDRALFSDKRFDANGVEQPDFTLNRAPWRHGSILIAGDNFGCGSSREHAVWALVQWGIRCVIAPSFGDIFLQNSVNSGLLAVRLPKEKVNTFVEEARRDPGAQWTIDLPAQLVVPPHGERTAFEIDATRKERLFLGLDEIALTHRHQRDIDEFEARQRREAPWLWRAIRL
jgi:3-isopropylmalate/(R)-2-methylmalate dehydratase small subunit